MKIVVEIHKTSVVNKYGVELCVQLGHASQS